MSPPFNLAPGRQISVRVTLDPANLPPGPVTKAVWVYVKGQDAPVATLEMTGVLLPTVVLSPASIDFGASSFGNSPTLSLAVTWNSQILPKGSRCRLVSTNPEVQIAPDPPGTEHAAPPVGPAAQAQTYRCIFSPQAHLGELQGSVQAVVTVPGAAPVVVGSAPLRGDVRGDVSAAPAVVAFGTVMQGRGTSRQITLTLAQPVPPAVTSASPYLTARLSSLTAAHQDRPFGGGAPRASPSQIDDKVGASQVLLVTLSGKAPAGPLETELTVTTRAGQRLRVPVYALILPSEAKP